MKTTITMLIAGVILFSMCAAARAEANPVEGRPFMGVLIDPAPLPRLLSLHLGLAVGQGLRVQNVQVDSPADKAGLERDDLIIRFQGEDVHDYERFVDAIRRAGSGTEVSLQVIHLGVRKSVKLTLGALEGEPQWKYPREPEAVHSWRPGRFFRLEPGDKDWKEMFKDGFPSDFDIDVKKFFNEARTYHHSNGEDYSVTIEGNPNDKDSTITVRIGDDEYKTTVDEIDKLPEKYREAAEDALENARKSRWTRKFDLKINPPSFRPPPDWKDYFEKLHPRNFPSQPLVRGEEMFEKLQEQIGQLREHLDDLEQRNRERWEKLEKYYDRLSPKDDEEDSSEPEEDVQPASADEQKA